MDLITHSHTCMSECILVLYLLLELHRREMQELWCEAYNRMVREEDGFNIVICMQFTIMRFLQASSLSVTCVRVKSVHFVTLSWKCHVLSEAGKIAARLRHGAEGSLRQQGCPDPFLPPLPRYPRPFHFPSLRLLRFVSFPLAPVWPAPHSPRLRLTRVLLTYSSPLGFEKFSLFWHSWDHFSGRVNEWQSSGILSWVQDHQEIQEMPGVVPGETGKGDKHTCSFICLAQQR